MKLNTEQAVITLEALREKMYKLKDEHNHRDVRIIQSMLDDMAKELSDNEVKSKESLVYEKEDVGEVFAGTS